MKIFLIENIQIVNPSNNKPTDSKDFCTELLIMEHT